MELSSLTDSQRASIAEALKLLQGIFGSIACPQIIEGDEPEAGLNEENRTMASLK